MLRIPGLSGALPVLLAASFTLSTALAPSAHAQWIGRQTGCAQYQITANPNRPTVDHSAEVTQYGILELEYGWERVWPGGGDRNSDMNSLLKFGVLCDIELRWFTNPYLWHTNGLGAQQGGGDNQFGLQVRFYKQTKRVPSLAIDYMGKAATASVSKGLGTGHTDHSITFLASKDFSKTHVDFNATYFLIGRAPGGFDRNWQFNLSFAHPLVGHLNFTSEIYGNTELNPATQGFASLLTALTYNISPRLVIDGGADNGLSHGAPVRRAFAGVTWSIARLYPARENRPRRRSARRRIEKLRPAGVDLSCCARRACRLLFTHLAPALVLRPFAWGRIFLPLEPKAKPIDSSLL